MISLPQSNSLQEIHRSLLELQTLIVKGSGSTVSSASLPKLTSSKGVVSTGTTSVVSETTDEITQTAQLVNLQAIEIDESDDLPATDEDDCAILSFEQVPVWMDPLSMYEVKVPVNGDLTFILPAGFVETKTFLFLSGTRVLDVRIEAELNDKSVVIYNDVAGTPGGVVTVAMPDLTPVDAGIQIPYGHLAYIREKIDNTGMEFVIYYQ